MGGAAAGAGIQAAAGHVDQMISFGLNAKAASMSWDRWKNSQTRGYLYQQEGLEKAGLNRILAVGAGIGGGLKGTAIQAHAAQKGGKIDNPMLAKLSGENMASNTAKTLADARTANALADLAELNLRFRKSKEGIRLYRQSQITGALPQTPAGMAGNAAYGVGSKIIDSSTVNQAKDLKLPSFTRPKQPNRRSGNTFGPTKSGPTHSPHIVPSDARPRGPQ